MPKRRSESDNKIQKSEMAETLLPKTPVRGKRRRRISDVIDSLGERASPTSSSSSVSSSASPAGFVTPQRTRTQWNTAISPDLGYSETPERVKIFTSTCTRGANKFDASVRTPDDENYCFKPVSAHAKMSASKDADRYNMEHRNRGKCIIFNHENFDTGFENRQGSSADTQRIEQTFQRLGFIVEIYDDYEYESIVNKITELSNEDHSDNDCICIFVLTHGQKNDFICAKNVVYKIDTIWKPFTADRCKTLAGKPKLFFFQACRGENLDGGIRMNRSATTETDSCTASYKIPTHADFLFAYSTMEGFYSWRDPMEGTWYIQSLCSILDEYAATTEFTKMLTLTARKVATDFASYNDLDPTFHDQKQVPSFTSMLIRDVYFTAKSE